MGRVIVLIFVLMVLVPLAVGIYRANGDKVQINQSLIEAKTESMSLGKILLFGLVIFLVAGVLYCLGLVYWGYSSSPDE